MTGGAFGTFAAFPGDAVHVTPDIHPVSHFAGVERRFCPACGSALTATFEYLPGQTYVPVGVLADADGLVPERHCHAEQALSWLEMHENLPRETGSGRNSLNKAAR